jgi:hypothetical protein
LITHQNSNAAIRTYAAFLETSSKALRGSLEIKIRVRSFLLLAIDLDQGSVRLELE